MDSKLPELPEGDFHRQLQDVLLQKNYGLATQLYEQAIEQFPENRANYWYLGLLLLLQGQELEAQTTWLLGMAEGSTEQIDHWTSELVEVLQAEVTRQLQAENYELSWVVCQHIRELVPGDLPNLLQIMQLALQQKQLTGDEIIDLAVIPVLKSSSPKHLTPEHLLQVLSGVLDIEPHLAIVEFTEAALPYLINVVDVISVLEPAVMRIAHTKRVPKLAADLLEVYLPHDPERIEIVGHLATFYQNNREYDKGIETARRYLQQVPTLEQKIFASHTLLRGLMSAGGYWTDALASLEDYKQLLAKLVEVQSTQIHPVHITRLVNTGYFLPYFQDDFSQNRWFQNQILQFCQRNIRAHIADQVGHYQKGLQARRQACRPQQKLKIGYLSHCLGTHSVGWLARWLIQHHDRSQFQLHGYFYSDRQNDPVFDWYLGQLDQFCRMGVECEGNSLALADRIYQDEIDILIDLDSITIDIGCELLTVKPAPIQVTWLGWDASGMDTIDYFLADPYVLPDDAQAHYVEKIWRLPQTYLAVDGFEVGVPTLRRDLLNIPNDAVIYLSAQTGYKRHPDTIRLQMQIIQQVPNSYFLIKGLGDQAAIQNVFIEIAEEVGVSRDRLRFLPMVDSEAVHRANLGIADVVLDTFPYNGATTTMETLWMGVPLVTRVGQQFASRNSYTMLKNAGIEEGIAWTDAEYVEWGVRLGQDIALREDIAWRLKRSRQTAPLWNGAAFTRDVEQAYQQMWAIYQENHRHVL
jgi:predicted O-linked N-acetylglucosamine transferase (SPINDLY family)